MNKKFIIVGLVLLVVIITGFLFYALNFPIGVKSVKIPSKIGLYNLNKTEKVHSKLLFGSEHNYAGWCMYSSYNPNPGLDTIYACEPSQDISESLNLWITADKNFLTGSDPEAKKFSEGNVMINSINVKTITLSETNCGNPGYCTSYFWRQGKMMFKSNVKEIVEEFIKINKGLF